VVLGVSGCPPFDKSGGDDQRYRASTRQLDPLAPQADGSLRGEALLEADTTDDTVRLAVPYNVLKSFGEKAAPPAFQP
jgi:hypothetical protein